MTPTISVIIPTRALAVRRDLFRAAIESVCRQEGVRTIPIVVLNGPDADVDLVREIRGRPGVRVRILQQANLPQALHEGRRAVDTEWFAELDDDDLLLPNALSSRLAVLAQHPECDAVVSNGVVEHPIGGRPIIDDVARVSSDPLAALQRGNWLAPGALLCHTDRIGESFFRDIPRYLEWTGLAVRLATRARLAFQASPTFVYREHTPASVVDSDDYVRGMPAAIDEILRERLPPALRRCFERRRAQACHDLARLEAFRGNRSVAWQWHLRSLRGAGGLRHLSFTRKLLVPGFE